MQLFKLSAKKIRTPQWKGTHQVPKDQPLAPPFDVRTAPDIVFQFNLDPHIASNECALLP